MPSSAATREFEAVIGLEIHVQLKTRSKMFCGCRVAFGEPPNSLVCPVCLGLPGALPVANQQALELGLRAALALGCEIHERSYFARKNYFYPDMPKGYQISQYDRPLATGGSLPLPEAEASDATARLRVRRLHLEEDSGKSLHDRYPGRTAVDLNRAGVPLAEIVTEPDFRSAAQARAFLGRLKQTLEYLGVSDCNMEEGSLRVDANVSVRPVGSAELATKTELKNMNSFSQLERALDYEVDRQLTVLGSGGTVEHQTMLWDPARREARPMRGKEEVHDYRYFPEPDLPALLVAPATTHRIAATLPELPWQKERRLMEAYGLPRYDAEVLSATRGRADYFEAVASGLPDSKPAANWVMTEMLALANERGAAVEELGVAPAQLSALIARVQEGALSQALGKQALRRLAETGQTVDEVIAERDLRKVDDSGQLRRWIVETLRANPEEVVRYRRGEAKLLDFFIGQVMRKSQGKADPDETRRLLVEELSAGR